MYEKRNYKLLFGIILVILLGGCDEGRLYEETKKVSSEGINIQISAYVENTGSWPASYTVSIAAFEEGTDYALLSKSVGAPNPETGFHEMLLSNIPAEATTIEICVINKLRQKIATFYSFDLTGDVENRLQIDNPIDVNMFDVIQNQVFNTTCANCHGASNFAAADLYLTSGKSYENLVEVKSTVMGEGNLRVKSGSRSKSVLYNILTGDVSSEWKYDHSSEITDYNTT